MSKVITIKEASISTLSVELKAIHVNAKQMTLSVFRQIQEEKCFDENFDLLGNAWGTINYFWDKCPQDNDTVLHIVWQKGDELRRYRFGNAQTDKDIIFSFTLEDRRRLEVINNWLSEKGGSYFCNIYAEYKLYRPESYSPCGEKYKQAIELKKMLVAEMSILENKIMLSVEKAKIYIKNKRLAYQKIASLPQLYIAA